MEQLIEGVHRFRMNEFGNYRTLFQRLSREGSEEAARAFPAPQAGSLRYSRPSVCATILALATALYSANARGELMPKLKPVPAYPAQATMAEPNHIPVSQFNPLSPSGTNTLQPGDSVTMLGTLIQKKSQAQWILHVSAAARDPKDKPEEKPKPFVMNAWEQRYTFESKPVPATLQMLGPFS